MYAPLRLTTALFKRAQDALLDCLCGGGAGGVFAVDERDDVVLHRRVRHRLQVLAGEAFLYRINMTTLTVVTTFFIPKSAEEKAAPRPKQKKVVNFS